MSVTITFKYDVGDVLKLAFPHDIKERIASFPDWEERITHCPGIVTVKICEITYSRGGEFFGGIGYMYSVLKPCECGKSHSGNYFKEGSEKIVKEVADER